MTIKTIRAKSGDSQTDDVYRLLVLTHRMAGALAVEKIGGWGLSKKATFDDFVLTEYTNGIINIKAESNKWYGGDEHIYTLSAVKTEE